MAETACLGCVQRTKSGASGEIRTLKHLLLRQTAIPIRVRWHSSIRGLRSQARAAAPSPIARAPPAPALAHPSPQERGSGFRLRAQLGSLPHIGSSWRKVDESNAHGSSPCPGFRDQLPAIQQYLPRLAESAGVEPASLLREPLFNRQVPYRPAHSPTKMSKNSGRPGGI